MTKEELIDQIVGEIQAMCALPYAPPTAEIERIIDLEMRWLFREYRDLNESGYYVLDKAYYQTPEWKATRTFQLPECVVGLELCQELTGGSRVFGINDPDMKFDRLMSADMYLSPLSSDQIATRTVQWSFWDLSRAFNLKDIQHNFNINTRRLKIKGRDPSESLFIFTRNSIPVQDAYEDPIVIKWMIAKAKISLARILGFFNYQLVGGVQINYADIRAEGMAELQEMKDKIADIQQCDFFVMFN